MTGAGAAPGALMAAEIAEAGGAFVRALAQPVALADPDGLRAIYTVARGSSDAAAGILAYEAMRELRLPVTTLPPSVFSLGRGVRLDGAAMLAVSQSGASDDLIAAARGALAAGARLIAIVNAPGSPLAGLAELTLTAAAGPELAVPATKSVVGSIGAGMALIAALAPAYAPRAAAAGGAIAALPEGSAAGTAALVAALAEARHVYVIGRDCGWPAALELALKLKECCELHAEAHSASEVLHGPLQLARKAPLALILDTGQPECADSLALATARLAAAGARTLRIGPPVAGLTPAAAAAALLIGLYPAVLATARALGLDPDRPSALAKVTRTR
jgi:glucosamine--fructose-6-phosphate aminotransferase (isomerizing)